MIVFADYGRAYLAASGWHDMTSDELLYARYVDADYVQDSDLARVQHEFRFPVGSLPQAPPVVWKLHYRAAYWTSQWLSLCVWRESTSSWVVFYHTPMPGVVDQTYTLSAPLSQYVSSNHVLLLADAVWIDDPQPAEIRTDCANLIYETYHVSQDTNLFGQRFRMYDDNAAGDTSFERLDRPGGSWSTPIQPFSGDLNLQADIKCLPDGRLQAAYLDSSGILQHAESYDDGETWTVL